MSFMNFANTLEYSVTENTSVNFYAVKADRAFAEIFSIEREILFR